MKCLILSTATGQGHNSAALAIAESLRKENCTAEIIDVLKSGKRDVSQRVSRLYSHITVYAPQIFRGLYRAGELVSSPKRRSPIFYLNTLYADELYGKICRFQPDVIACTHIFGAQAVTCLREKYGLRIPAAAVLTDYTCSPFWEETALDGYVIPSEKLADEFSGKGVPSEKLIPIGIPVRAQFQEKVSKQAARKNFGFTAKHVFIVMGGSMGYGKIGKLAAALAALPDSQAAAVCGKNKKLFRRLSKTANVVPLEYIEEMGTLMDAADVIFTKPGGLSSTEALVKRVPTVLTRPIPGCEQKNAEFLCSVGAAAFSDNCGDAVHKAKRLVSDASLAGNMIEAQEKYIRDDSARKISDYLIALGKFQQKA